MDKIDNVITIFFGLIILTTVLSSCATTNSQLIIAHYKYEIDDKTYRIRSINSEKIEESYNELISEKFVAVDFNQDRIIDRIVMGEADLSEVQEIYEHGLQLSAGEDKLDQRASNVSQFTKGEQCCLYEIKTFRSKNADPFNEFILIEKRNTPNPHTMVGIDQNADGTLDKVLKGSTTLDRMQPKYKSMIDQGLDLEKMIKLNGMILVKDGEVIE